MIFEKIQAVKPRTFYSISCFLAMNHKAFCFNAFSENTYIIWDDNKEGLIIDPGCSNTVEENELYAFLQDEKITLRYHLLTHAHIDHVLGCNFIFTKFGLNPEDVFDVVKEISALEHVKIKGLMQIAPFVDDPEDNRKYFRAMKQLSVDINNKNFDNVDMSILSMGMTNDYEIAVEEGATMVRVGTAIFGERNYNI